MAENKKIVRITTDYKQPASHNKSSDSSKQDSVKLHRERGKVEKRSIYSNVVNESAGPSGSRKK